MVKVLVTGAAGFLGKNVVKVMKSSNKYNMLTIDGKHAVDLLETDNTFDYFNKNRPDVVIHCAAHVGGIAYNALHPVEVFYDNTYIGLNIVRACAESGVKVLINIMPNCVYPGEMDMYEESKWWDGPIHSSVMTYGLPRKMLWGACFAYCQKYTGFKPVHLILPNMYGPADHFEIVRSHALGALISKIVDAKLRAEKTVKIWGTGKPVREWLYVKDGAQAVLKTIQNIDRFEQNEIMNIGVTKGISIGDLAELIKSIVGWDGEFVFETDKPDGAMKKILIADKMMSKLAWKPDTEIREGIKQTIEWYYKRMVKS